MTLKNLKLALPKESEKLPWLLMMMTLIWREINRFTDASTAGGEEDPDT